MYDVSDVGVFIAFLQLFIVFGFSSASSNRFFDGLFVLGLVKRNLIAIMKAVADETEPRIRELLKSVGKKKQQTPILGEEEEESVDDIPDLNAMMHDLQKEMKTYTDEFSANNVEPVIVRSRITFFFSALTCMFILLSHYFFGADKVISMVHYCSIILLVYTLFQFFPFFWEEKKGFKWASGLSTIYGSLIIFVLLEAIAVSGVEFRHYYKPLSIASEYFDAKIIILTFIITLILPYIFLIIIIKKKYKIQSTNCHQKGKELADKVEGWVWVKNSRKLQSTKSSSNADGYDTISATRRNEKA